MTKSKICPRLYKPWTTREKDFVVQNYRKISDEEIARCLGRSAGAVDKMAVRLGLKKRESDKKI